MQIFVNAWARSLGLTSINPELVFGSLFSGKVSPGATRLGILFHVAAGGFLALFYIWIFDLFRQSGWRIGAKIAVLQWLIIGVLLDFFPLGERYFPRYFRAPGLFWSQESSLTSILMFLEYVFFGVVIGSVYNWPIWLRKK
jgi:hypothetical protein